LYLPPYSPDLNPIENAFSKLKGLLRPSGRVVVGDRSAARPVQPARVPELLPALRLSETHYTIPKSALVDHCSCILALADTFVCPSRRIGPGSSEQGGDHPDGRPASVAHPATPHGHASGCPATAGQHPAPGRCRRRRRLDRRGDCRASGNLANDRHAGAAAVRRRGARCHPTPQEADRPPVPQARRPAGGPTRRPGLLEGSGGSRSLDDEAPGGQARRDDRGRVDRPGDGVPDAEKPTSSRGFSSSRSSRRKRTRRW
jgi:DDE superfamily endonuclease